MLYSEIYLYLFSPFFALILQVVLNRLLYPKLSAQVIALLSIFIAGFLCFGWGLKIADDKGALHILFSVFLTFGMLHIYFHFFNMSETARRIRILLTIQFKTDYLEGQSLSLRVTRLSQLGLIKEEDGKLRLTKNPLKYLAIWLVKIEYCLFPERKP